MLAITFWPTVYALVRRRPIRAASYFVVSLIGFAVSALVAQWWEARNPDGDWEFGSPGVLYYGLSWPVTTAAAWAVAAVSDVVLAQGGSQRRMKIVLPGNRHAGLRSG